MIRQLLYSALIIALSATNVLAQCVQSDEPALKAVSNGANRFANNFFKTLAKSEPKNFICSPLGVNVVLSMANIGARGSTEKQLESSLSLPCDKSITKSGFQELIDSLNKVKGAELKLANKIFTANQYELQPEFSEVLETYFRSKTQSVNFGKPEEAADIINNWSANQTNSRITKLFKADDLQDVALVLVNAVYFKGKWANKFSPELTTLAPFYTDEKNWKNVSMMQRHGEYHWGVIHELNAQFIELPYESDSPEEALSMYVILPSDINNGLQKVEDEIEKINFANLSGHRGFISLYMPKFKIENKFDLKPTLQKMGITEIFENTANLPGIIKGPPVKVDKIIQKSFIEVNEEGSEAAAVTGILIGESVRPGPPQRPEIFKVDRPFIYVIVHRSSNTVLFQGRTYNPV